MLSSFIKANQTPPHSSPTYDVLYDQSRSYGRGWVNWILRLGHVIKFMSLNSCQVVEETGSWENGSVI